MLRGKHSGRLTKKPTSPTLEKKEEWSFGDIAELFGESEATIRIRVKSIEMMKDNEDNERQHFSYYDVLTRSKEISKGMKKAGGWDGLLSDIKNLGSKEEANTFTAQDLRKKTPGSFEET